MPKVSIRPQRISDARRFYDILVNPHFTYWVNTPSSVERESQFLKLNSQKRRKNFAHNFTILYEGKIVGGCGIKINQHFKYIGMMGYFVDEAFWGKGIATAAVRQLEKIGFTELSLARIEIVMEPGNKASEQVAIKSGYQKEGTMRKMVKRNGVFYDCHLYAKVL